MGKISQNLEYNLIGIPEKPSTPCCWNCETGMNKYFKRTLNTRPFTVCDNKHCEFYGKEMKPKDGCKLCKKRQV